MDRPLNHEESLFFRKKPNLYPCYVRLSELILSRFPSTIIQVKNTQISFVEKHLYACVSFLRFKKSPELPKDYFVLTLGMPYLVQSPRLKMAVEPYPGRFTTHIPIGSIEDIDNELMGWLADAHRFALTK